MTEKEGTGGIPEDTERLAGDSRLAAEETEVADVPGSPTWPIVPPGELPAPPPVGLNWGTVSARLGLDLRMLLHEGMIVVAGDYFPSSGFFFNPDTFEAQHVDVGDIALRHGYFVGDLTARDFAEWFPLAESRRVSGKPVIRQERGPITGLFAQEQQAARAKRAIMQGALGAGIRMESGTLGFELRVSQPESAGAVASVIASYGGAVIALGGKPVASSGADRRQAMSTAPSLPAEEADAYRPGTGSSSDSETPAAELGGSEEFNPL